MDREGSGGGVKRDWSWLPTQMPGVARLMADKRRELGDAWVNTCWKNGVVQGQPGWFWASEGGLNVGTLWDDAEVIALAQQQFTPTQAMVILRPKEEGGSA